MGSAFPRLTTLFALVLGAGAPSAAGQSVWYVDNDVCPSMGSGSQGDPFCDLQDALAVAASGDQIRVIDGEYRPAGPGGPRETSFVLKDGVAVYGGFPPGGGDGSFEIRDPDVFITTLSGDLNGDDDAGGDNSENSYHVVTATLVDGSAVLDGFTIQAGNANDEKIRHDAGGGMRNDSASPTVRHCTFVDNHAVFGGGVEDFNGSHGTFLHCQFFGNTASFRGGGMHNNSSRPHVEECLFDGNFATNSGGGMRNTDFSAPVMIACTFNGNSAGFGGAAVNDDSNATYLRCEFTGNSAISETSGAIHNFRSNPQITMCRFIGNTAGTGGGAIHSLAGSEPTIRGCVFRLNSAGVGGAIHAVSNTVVTMVNCSLSENAATFDLGGAVYNGPNATVNITNSILWNNTLAEVQTESAESPVIRYSDVRGGWFGAGSNNIDADPVFADDDLRISAMSPCVDAGDDSAVDLTNDLDGGSRIVGAAVDMGAYEVDSQAIPTMSQWGVIVMILILGTCLIDRVGRTAREGIDRPEAAIVEPTIR